VRVSAHVLNSVVQVAVTDTGPGIDDDEQESIFEVFQQGRRGSAALRPEGSGLGLPLARRFVELHGGRLWVESARGKGTTFRFTMPVSQDA
jgi:signal transduction histidine kinase